MGVRGKRSSADLAVVRRVSSDRLLAPDHLDAAESAEWRAIVDSLPADWFRPGDIPLLAEFCSASAMAKQCQIMLKVDGMVITDDRRSWAHPAVSIQQMQRSAMAQLAVKLRLCPSARYTPKAAGTGVAKAGGQRPWEAASGE